MSHAAKLRSHLDSLPDCAPERLDAVLVAMMDCLDAILREHGWTPSGLLVTLPKGVTHEMAQAAIDALAEEAQ